MRRIIIHWKQNIKYPFVLEVINLIGLKKILYLYTSVLSAGFHDTEVHRGHGAQLQQHRRVDALLGRHLATPHGRQLLHELLHLLLHVGSLSRGALRQSQASCFIIRYIPLLVHKTYVICISYAYNNKQLILLYHS